LTNVEHQLNPHNPLLKPNLERLMQYYLRMMIQLSFTIPRLPDLATQLTSKQRRNHQISLGTSSLGFVGAALGVAGAAAMLTPAGPAILLAAICTSATSGTLQVTHAGYQTFLSNKEANQLADRVVGWHGLCLGILNSLEQLRQDLLEEHQNANANNGSGNPNNAKNYRRLHSKNNPNLDVWNAVAVGGFGASRHAMTGVGVTSAMGASYSQAFTTGLQGIPVVGAAFSVGCMAMDAASMQSSLKQLQQPSAKALALKQIEESFPIHIPNTIHEEVGVLLEAVADLHAKIEEQRREQERELIEKELEGI
jgi:hypothetical protein